MDPHDFASRRLGAKRVGQLFRNSSADKRTQNLVINYLTTYRGNEDKDKVNIQKDKGCWFDIQTISGLYPD